jgi:hypothetical protein
MQIINVIGDLSPNVWERQRLIDHGQKYNFHYKHLNKNAHWSVHIGNATIKYKPVQKSTNIFMFVEPPEIYKYKYEDLKRFEIVAGPKFPDYVDLPNFIYSQVALPWSVGISYPELKNSFQKRILRKTLGQIWNLPTKPPEVNFNANQLINFDLPKEKFLSIVTSSKADTPMQKKRLEFIKYLNSRNNIPIEIYGRGFKHIHDKFEILSKSSHHLALENSIHEGYWTEKLTDSILSLNKTYYSGAPNINEHFNSEIVVPIDLADFYKAASIIEEDFINNVYSKSSLEKARMVLVKEKSFESIILGVIACYQESGGKQ